MLACSNHRVYTVRDHIPLADFAQIYEKQHLPTLAPGGREQQHCLLKNHVTPALGAKRLCDVGTLEVQAFLNVKATEGLSWWTRRALKAVLSSMFTIIGLDRRERAVRQMQRQLFVVGPSPDRIAG